MTRAPILIRVDGTSRLGWESMARCLTFAAALQRRRRPTYFLSQIDSTEFGFTIKRGGNDWLPTEHPLGSPEDLEATLRQIRRLNPAAVIVDGVEITTDYLRALQDVGPLVVSLDHHAAIPIPSRLLINPYLGPGRDNFTFSARTQILMGSRYALVRPEIRRVRPLRAQEPAQPYRVLVALGEDDPHQQSSELAKLLLNCSRVGRVDILARNHYPHLADLRALAERAPDRLEVATEPAEIAARLVRCHMAVTAGNGWSQELACVGVPQLIIVQNEAHWPTAQRLEEEGAAICLGWHENVSAQTIRHSVHDLLGDPLERQSMARCGRKLFDGRGPDRLVTALEVMLHCKDRTATLQAA